MTGCYQPVTSQPVDFSINPANTTGNMDNSKENTEQLKPKTLAESVTERGDEKSATLQKEIEEADQEALVINPEIETGDPSETINKPQTSIDQLTEKVEKQKQTEEIKHEQTAQQLRQAELQEEQSITEQEHERKTKESTPSSSPQVNSSPSQQQAVEVNDRVLTFAELYEGSGVRGLQLSEKVKRLANQQVEMQGFMAPPLTADVTFFVLTKVHMAVCPFCSTEADWPADIVVVYMPNGTPIDPTNHPIKVTGTLDIGTKTDELTGFVSLIRIYADKVEVLK